jgi:hypothetical protein
MGEDSLIQLRSIDQFAKASGNILPLCCLRLTPLNFRERREYTALDGGLNLLTYLGRGRRRRVIAPLALSGLQAVTIDQRKGQNQRGVIVYSVAAEDA